MKKAIMAAVLAAFVCSAQAQDLVKEHKTPEQRAQALTARMTKDLGLNNGQAAKVEAINLKYAEQGAAIRAEQEKQREMMRKEGEGQRKALRESHDAELRSVLSPEQFATWQKQCEEMKAKHMERRKEMRERRAAPDQPAEEKQ